MDLGGAKRSRSPSAASPVAFCLLFRHGKRRSPPAGGETTLRKEPSSSPMRASGPTKKRSIIAPSSVTASPCHLPPEGKAFLGGIISSSVQPSASHLPPRGKALWGMAPSSAQVEGLKGRRNPPKFTFSAEGGGAPAPPPGRRTSCLPGTVPGRSGR